MFKDKILLITGETGSFGNAVLRRFLQTDIARLEFLAVMKKSRTICEPNTKIPSGNFLSMMCVI